MKTLDRYIAGIFTRNLAVALVAMTFLFVFQEVLAELFDRHYYVNQILTYNLLSIPQTTVNIAPTAVLLATVLTLSGLARTQELVACYSLGTGLRRVMALILSIVVILGCLILVFQDRILPPVFRKRTNYKMMVMDKRNDFFLDVKRDKIWYRSKNLIYNLQSFDTEAKTIRGMSVYTFDQKFDLVQMVSAKKAEYTPEGWNLVKGTTTVFSKVDSFPMTQEFAEKKMTIHETPKDFQEIEKEVDSLRLKELYHYVNKTKAAGADTKAYEVKLHSRISLSFVPVVMCFLAIPFSVRNRREGGVAKDLALCLVITFFYWLFYSVGLSLGKNGVLVPWVAAWLPSMVFLSLSAGLLLKRS